MPQLSVSTSSITTTVVFGFFPKTSTSNCVAPFISSAFFSGVTSSFVILIFTYGIKIPSFNLILIEKLLFLVLDHIEFHLQATLLQLILHKQHLSRQNYNFEYKMIGFQRLLVQSFGQLHK